MTSFMTYEQAEMLATLTSSLRTDWGVPGIVAALEKVASTHDAMELTLATLHAADDPSNRTPAIIALPGRHWDLARGTVIAPRASFTPGTSNDTSPMCPQHPDLHEWECKTCNVPSPKPPTFDELVAAAAEQARAERASQLTNV
jgi:hypothetical protein